VYFFFEPDEHRQSDGRSRVVRVGTHGLRPGSGSMLWGRLRQHHGPPTEMRWVATTAGRYSDSTSVWPSPNGITTMI
jgi:hypothetical protein